MSNEGTRTGHLHTDHRVAKSTRAERAARDSTDITKPGDLPQIGRDHPWIEGPEGFPVAKWETRVQAYGEQGLYHETKCQNCSHWISYKMCPGCSSMLRMMGSFDRNCRCRLDSLQVYLRCEDHKPWEL